MKHRDSPATPSHGQDGRAHPTRRRGWRDLDIGRKLNLGFGLLVALTLVVIALGYLASGRASTSIERTNGNPLFASCSRTPTR